MNAHTDSHDPLALLAWHVAMGADEAIEDCPLDRFTSEAPPAPVVAAAPQQTTQKPLPQPNTGPRPIAARPALGAEGAGSEAATHVAEACNSLEELEAALKAFDGGLLKRSAKNTVFADGVAGAPVMIVGEAPGADEDRQGKPFVGASGQLLDRMLNAAGFDRQKNVYISNVVPWRPLGNRTPDQAVIAMCLPFIRRHIELAKPKIVLMLGGVSAKALLGTDEGITRVRGKWRTLEIGDQTFAAIAAYHPAYLLRQPQLKGYAWRDLLAVKEKLSS